MRVLVACEFSGIVRDAFIERGHDAVSCDILPSEKPGPHYQGDVLELLKRVPDWDLLIAHPPCTYLSNSGVRHLHAVPSRNGKVTAVAGPARWVEMHKAAEFFVALRDASIPRVCIENPVPHRYARNIIGNYSQSIQPWQFGHGETKRTCLWLRNLPELKPTLIVAGREPRIHKMSPSKERGRLRSITFQGIAEAMADQWGVNSVALATA